MLNKIWALDSITIHPLTFVFSRYWILKLNHLFTTEKRDYKSKTKRFTKELRDRNMRISSSEGVALYIIQLGKYMLGSHKNKKKNISIYCCSTICCCCVWWCWLFDGAQRLHHLFFFIVVHPRDIITHSSSNKKKKQNNQKVCSLYMYLILFIYNVWFFFNEII